MWEYLVLGVIQGLLEWIPISSEGVIAILSGVLVDANPLDMALFLHLGTMLAILIYFRKDWYRVVMLEDHTLIKFLVISTVVSLLFGYYFYEKLSAIAVGWVLLAIVGLGLLGTSYLGKKKAVEWLDVSEMAVVAGLMQGLAVIPGLSRSGSTIFGISLGELSSEDVLKYSYMMSVPAVAASAFYVWLNNPLIVEAWPSVITSFLVGLVSLKYLLKWSEEVEFWKFTMAFGILCLVGAVILLF